MTGIFARALAAALAVSVFSPALIAAQPAERPDEAVFAFGGRYFTNHMEGFLNPGGPLGLNYEDNFVFGGGYQRFLIETDVGARFGVEGGVAMRAGERVAGEAWAGLVGRYEGLAIGPVAITPSLTVGVSAVTDTIGIEGRRVAPDANPHVLIYIAPEIATSIGGNSDVEAFYRIQHRSGAWGTVAGMGDGANASTIGLRFRY
jgi:preprotein translocase subunit Sec61beta